MTRKQRVTRVVYGIYVVVVAAFVISNIAQVAAAVFGPSGAGEAAGARFPKVGEACARQIEAELQTIEKARLAASSETSDPAAKARYAAERASARAGDPAELERTCKADPHGVDALAALARFDRAAESHAVRTASELSPVRLSAQSFIRGPR